MHRGVRVGYMESLTEFSMPTVLVHSPDQKFGVSYKRAKYVAIINHSNTVLFLHRKALNDEYNLSWDNHLFIKNSRWSTFQFWYCRLNYSALWGLWPRSICLSTLILASIINSLSPFWCKILKVFNIHSRAQKHKITKFWPPFSRSDKYIYYRD